MKTLAERLTHVREATGLRQQDLADFAGCSPAQIGHLCTGFRTDPATSYLTGIARRLRIDLDWLADGQGEAPTAAHLHDVGAEIRAAQSVAENVAPTAPEAA